MKFNIITIFPKNISDYCDETILARAIRAGIIKINAINLRDFADDKHQKVDDTTYGGGAGMVMKPEPIFRALQSIGALSGKDKRYKKQDTNNIQYLISNIQDLVTTSCNVIKKVFDRKKNMTVLLSPRGKQFDQRMAEQLSKMKEISFVCGRYEGVDQHVADYMVDEEISIGPYVLAGGELGALVIVEAVSRLLPGVLGNEESLSEETFNLNDKCQISNDKSSSKLKYQNLMFEICNLSYADYF